MAQCDKVIEQVNLSFVPVPKQGTVSPMSPPMTPGSARPKSSGNSFLESRRSSPSSLLMSLLSPLISSSSSSSSDASAGSFAMQQARASHQGRPTSTMAVQRAANPSKFHRRQARSMLVDTFRQFVLPSLKASLPSTYLYLTIESDLAKKREEWNTLQTEIEALLEKAEYQRTTTVSVLRRPSLGRHNASSNFRRGLANLHETEGSAPSFRRSMSASSSASTIKPEAITSLAPALYISTLPAYTELPTAVRVSYATMHRRINDLSSRLASLDRLNGDLRSDQDRREEMEACELAKNEQKGIRRACSNGTISPIDRHLRPTRSSPLATCVFPEVEASSPVKLTKATLSVEQDDEFAMDIQVRPISPSLGQCSSSDMSDDSSDEDEDEDLLRQHMATAFADFCISSPPALVYNRSVESLESEDGSPATTPPCDREANEDDHAMFICPKSPRPGSVSQLSPTIFGESSPALRRMSLDSIDQLIVPPVQDEDDTHVVRHDELLVDLVSGRRKSEGMIFPWVQTHQPRASVC